MADLGVLLSSESTEQLPFASQQRESEASWNISTAPGPSTSADAPFIVKLKGFPYDSTKAEIAAFLHDCTIKGGDDGIHLLVGADNRPSGCAVVELENHASMQKAVDHDHQNMGSRYVEITIISEEQMKADLNTQLKTTQVSGGDFFVKLRGMPFSSTAKNVVSFLPDCQIVGGDDGVHFTVAHEGRASGDAYVELLTEEDVSRALSHNKEHMGRRYVEIFRATRGQMEYDCQSGVEGRSIGGGGVGGGLGEGPGVEGGVVRLRGLPFGCTEDQVRIFFSGLKVVMGGVVIQVEPGGRETGEAFVELHTQADADKALEWDRNKIGHRYIEVFRSSYAEIRPVKGGPASNRPTPYDRPGAEHGGYGFNRQSGYERQYRGARGRGGHTVQQQQQQYPAFGGYAAGGYYEPAPPQEFYAPPPPTYLPPPPRNDQSMVAYPPIRPTPPQQQQQPKPAAPAGPTPAGKTRHEIRMRGLPYSAKEKEITDFFAPLTINHLDIDIDNYGRPSGEALVYFNSHEDATAAMQKNKNNIGYRYIELFLNSGSSDSQPGYGGAPQQQRFQAPPPQQQAAWSDPRTQQQQPMTQMSMYGGGGGGGGGYAQSSQPAQQTAVQQPQRQQYATGGAGGGGYQQQQAAQPAAQQQQQQQQQHGYQQNTGYAYGQQQQQQPAVASGYAHQQSGSQQHSWY